MRVPRRIDKSAGPVGESAVSEDNDILFIYLVSGKCAIIDPVLNASVLEIPVKLNRVRIQFPV